MFAKNYVAISKVVHFLNTFSHDLGLIVVQKKHSTISISPLIVLAIKSLLKSSSYIRVVEVDLSPS